MKVTLRDRQSLMFISVEITILSHSKQRRMSIHFGKVRTPIVNDCDNWGKPELALVNYEVVICLFVHFGTEGTWFDSCSAIFSLFVCTL